MKDEEFDLARQCRFIPWAGSFLRSRQNKRLELRFFQEARCVESPEFTKVKEVNHDVRESKAGFFCMVFVRT
jgi:hypothetical protein